MWHQRTWYTNRLSCFCFIIPQPQGSKNRPYIRSNQKHGEIWRATWATSVLKSCISVQILAQGTHSSQTMCSSSLPLCPHFLSHLSSSFMHSSRNILCLLPCWDWISSYLLWHFPSPNSFRPTMATTFSSSENGWTWLYFSFHDCFHGLLCFHLYILQCQPACHYALLSSSLFPVSCITSSFFLVLLVPIPSSICYLCDLCLCWPQYSSSMSSFFYFWSRSCNNFIWRSYTTPARISQSQDEKRRTAEPTWWSKSTTIRMSQSTSCEWLGHCNSFSSRTSHP